MKHIISNNTIFSLEGVSSIISLLIFIIFICSLLSIFLSAIVDLLNNRKELVTLATIDRTKNKNKDDGDELVRRLRLQRDYNTLNNKRLSYLSEHFPKYCNLSREPALLAKLAATISISGDSGYTVKANFKVYEGASNNIARTNVSLVCVVQNTLGV